MQRIMHNRAVGHRHPGTTRRRAITVLSVAALLLAVLAGPASAQSNAGTVTVVHGVPGLTADVYVNDDLTLEDFEPGTVTDPLELPAGNYDVAIRPAGEDPGSDPAISGSATVDAGSNARSSRTSTRTASRRSPRSPTTRVRWEQATRV